ncbi:MAG: phosphoribosylformylglycinamidine synthase subunit PurL [Planctomycetota bacterium]|nr:phosphoribosylformylglycinamidine synthase subunit PurL [Planctomycetota bacterium]
MLWRISVALRDDIADPAGAAMMSDARDLGITGIEDVRCEYVYLLESELSREDVTRIAAGLLADPVTEKYSVAPSAEKVKPLAGCAAIHVFRKTGVMDPVEASVLKGCRDMGLAVTRAKTGRRIDVRPALAQAALETFVRKAIANEVVDEFFFGQFALDHLPQGRPYRFARVELPFLGATDEQLVEMSRRYVLSLNLEEMRAVADHFEKLGRNPTDVEAETIAQTWSEHCKHKTLTGIINYDGKTIDNLLKSTVMRVTRELNRPWCISVFKDNAGIIEFDDKNAVCFKVETHNHPSAIEPYGGAGTGIGGVIRDTLGCGLGAKPILNTDIFCFAPPDFPAQALPKGVLHPKRVMKGVVSGVRDYGNRMGIPTASGAVYFDDRYLANPLVYVGNIGVMPRDKCFKAAKPGDIVVVAGGRTGRDGIHGATFSSVELTTESEVISGGAVQIGDAIAEKKVTDALIQARDLDLYNAVTDCGAGGLSSAVGEMGADLGAEVELEKVPLKYVGLSPVEIWISEAQERMVFAVPPEKLQRLLDLFNSEAVETTPIGRFTSDKKLVLRYEGAEVCRVDMDFLHDGVPRFRADAVWRAPERTESPAGKKTQSGRKAAPAGFADLLRRMLGSWNTCSREWIIRQYDHEVQGGSSLKPLVGAQNDGPGDACVVRPVLGSDRGIAVSCGMNPAYGDIDPYLMAASAIDEAVRNIVAVGGSVDRTALLDNFCWGNTRRPETLGGLVRASLACYDVAKAYGTPFISGKDSLNNEFRVKEEGQGEKMISIPPSLLISGIAVVDDVKKCVSMDFKKADNAVYVVGLTRAELGGSQYAAVAGPECVVDTHRAPVVDTAAALRSFRSLHGAILAGLVRSCHDLSEGGLAVAAAEMAFAGGVGVEICLASVLREKDAADDGVILFSESNSRFLVEVEERRAASFEKAMAGCAFARVGSTKAGGTVKFIGLGGGTVVEDSVSALKAAWQTPMKW